MEIVKFGYKKYAIRKRKLFGGYKYYSKHSDCWWSGSEVRDLCIGTYYEIKLLYNILKGGKVV